MGRFFKRGQAGGDRAGSSVYAGLRAQALDFTSLELPPRGAESPDVARGVVVDVPAGQGGFVTLVALCDGSSSMYTSVGGGVIGAGSHPAVAAANLALRASVQQHLPALAASDDSSHPAQGLVRFFVLTPGDRRVADVSEDAFWGRATDQLTPVIAAAQNLITALREVSPPS